MIFLYRRHLLILLVRVGTVFWLKDSDWVDISSLFSWNRWDIFQHTSPSSINTNDDIINPSGTTTLASPDAFRSISLDHIVDHLSDHSAIQSTGTFITTESLHTAYNQNPSRETTNALLQRLIQEFEYNQAYSIIQELDQQIISSLDVHVILRIMFNSVLLHQTDGYTTIESFIDHSKQSNRISDKEAQRYYSLLALSQQKKEQFLTTIQWLHTTGALGKTIDTFRYRLQQTQKGRDIPSEYQDGMVALWLFEQGYTILAQDMALDILGRFPQYILPKQILAYSRVILQDRRQAKSYFLDLITQDPTHKDHYQFFVGLSSYRMENYVDALLYLNQIKEEKITSDVLRYTILSYIHLNDYSKIAKSMKALLGHVDMRDDDMLLFWEKAVFEPYVKQQSYYILTQDPTLLDLYLKRCSQGKFSETICLLGKIAQQVTLKQHYHNEDDIKTLLQSFPYTYLYYILWETARHNNNLSGAQQYFIKALSLTNDQTTREHIKKTLEQTL